MKPIKSLIASIVTATAAATAAAGAWAANEDVSFYAGIQGGYQDTSVKLKDTDFGNDTYTSFDSLSVDGLAGGIFAGVRFNTNSPFFVAGELNLGTSRAESKLKLSGPGSPISDTSKIKSRGTYGAALLGGFEVAPSTSLYGRLGYQKTKFEASEVSSKKHNGFRYGLGLETKLSNELALRVDWSRTIYSSESHRYADGKTKVEPTENLFQVGLAYTF